MQYAPVLVSLASYKRIQGTLSLSNEALQFEAANGKKAVFRLTSVLSVEHLHDQHTLVISVLAAKDKTKTKQCRFVLQDMSMCQQWVGELRRLAPNAVFAAPQVVEIDYTDLDGDTVEYALTPAMIASIFSQHPHVLERYRSLVPSAKTETEFWTEYLQSQYFHQSRVAQPQSKSTAPLNRVVDLSKEDVMENHVQSDNSLLQQLNHDAASRVHATHTPKDRLTGMEGLDDINIQAVDLLPRTRTLNTGHCVHTESSAAFASQITMWSPATVQMQIQGSTVFTLTQDAQKALFQGDKIPCMLIASNDGITLEKAVVPANTVARFRPMLEKGQELLHEYWASSGESAEGRARAVFAVQHHLNAMVTTHHKLQSSTSLSMLAPMLEHCIASLAKAVHDADLYGLPQ